MTVNQYSCKGVRRKKERFGVKFLNPDLHQKGLKSSVSSCKRLKKY